MRENGKQRSQKNEKKKKPEMGEKMGKKEPKIGIRGASKWGKMEN